MKGLRVFVWAFFLIGLIACHASSDNYVEKMKPELEQISNFSRKKYSFIVIIPNAGCTGCISEAVSFFQNTHDERIFFVFTNISSVKEFRLMMGKSIVGKNNLYVDEDNIFLHEDENVNAYPIVADIRDWNNVSWRFLDPGQDLENLFSDDLYK